MTRSLANKRFLVFGGSGAIGKVVVEALLDAGSFVDVAAHNHRRAHQKLDEVKKRCQRDMLYITRGVNVCDYRTLGDMWSADYATPDAEDYYHYLDGIVYAVGNCPSGGFDEAVSLPLTDLDQETFEEEFNRQVVGLQNVSRFFGNLELDSAVLVIGSAITRLTDEQCPSWLHAGQYAVAKAAQAELIKWLRRDPIVRERRILIHRLAPAAVDTPFHQGCQHQPPVMLSIDKVAQRVLETLQSDTIIDEMMLPTPPD